MRHPFGVLSLLLAAAVSSASAQADGGLPRRPWFGAEIAPAPASDSAGKGVLIRNVLPGSPAAGTFEPNDILLRFDGQPLSGVPQFLALLRRQRSGTASPVELRRGDRTLNRTVTLAELPRESGEGYTVTYTTVGAPGARRRVIITQPIRSALSPAVLLIGGIGCYSLDSPLTPPDAYRRILEGLTRLGYITMRVEKGGMGDSEGDCASQDFEQELAGYVAGARLLKSLPYVDSARVFLFGHSIGGIADPLVAAQVPVRGVIAMATVVQPWFDYELENTRRQLALSGVTGADLDAGVAAKRACMQRLLLDREVRARILADRPDCAGFFQYPASDRYLQQVAALDLRTAWSNLAARVLAIYPASDFVTARHDHDEIAEIVNRARPGTATSVVIPETDHYFQQVTGPEESFRLATQGIISQSFNPRVIQVISDWMGRQG